MNLSRGMKSSYPKGCKSNRICRVTFSLSETDTSSPRVKANTGRPRTTSIILGRRPSCDEEVVFLRSVVRRQPGYGYEISQEILDGGHWKLETKQKNLPTD